MMERYSWCILLFTALAAIDPGSSFLFKRTDKSAESSDSVAHLKRRYWNDEVHPCIVNYCLPYLGKKSQMSLYIKCLQDHCPNGILKVPRDLDAMSLFPIAYLLGDTEFCADNSLSNSPAFIGNFDPSCPNGDCDVENMISGADDDHLSTLKYGVYNLCRRSMCADFKGESHYECVRERCCGQAGGNSNHKRAIDMLAGPETAMTRKRRVNDEVSQCIQSYCSGTQNTARIVCIVKNCNRN